MLYIYPVICTAFRTHICIIVLCSVLFNLFQNICSEKSNFVKPAQTHGGLNCDCL
nr:MAG TPA_asm: hypothetical protein [Caudoviricetes sp.]